MMQETAFIPPLESFGRYHEEPKSSGGRKRSKPRPPSKRQQAYVRWDVDKLSLVDMEGDPLTDTMFYKAWAYAFENYMEVVMPKIYVKPSVVYGVWRCLPLPGYKQPRIVKVAEYTDNRRGIIMSCECQRCQNELLMCSHMIGWLWKQDRYPINFNVQIVLDVEEMEL